jgi:hypothetical protein
LLVRHFVLLAVLALLLAPPHAYAHPGWGIVVDAQGQVYFTDLEQVWRIDRQGRCTVFVPHVHSHGLLLEGGNLYGEHLWYGEAEKQFHSRQWRARPDGTVSDATLGEEALGLQQGMARDAEGNLYRVAGDGVERVAPAGTATVIAAHLVDPIPSYDPAGGGRFNRLLGVAVDTQGEVYVANYGNRRVSRISPQGVTTFYRGSLFWGPSGVTVAGDDVYILESGIPPVEGARVRKVAADGSVSTLATVIDPLTYVLFGIVAAVVLMVAGVAWQGRRWWRRRRKRALDPSPRPS